MQRTVLVLVLCMGLVWTGLAYAQPVQREVVVNIPGFTLYLYENGVAVRSYPISIGSELKPSQMGETTIINKVSDPTYYPPRWWERGLEPIPPGPDNPVGTRWLGLGFSSYGIHGTNNPASIGKAASSGCIRMRNSDVEELADLVRIGTPVKLLYQTVLFGQDPIFGHRTVTIYPDIYNIDTTRQQLEEGIKKRGWDDVFWPALEEMLAEANGREECLPLVVPLYYNGELLKQQGVKVGSRFYVPYSTSLSDELEGKHVQEWNGEYYVEVGEYAGRLGLSLQVADSQIALRSPQAYFGEQYLGSALIIDEDVYIPVDSLSDLLAVQSDSLVPQQLTVVSFQGSYYVPVEAVYQSDGEVELRIEIP